MDKYLINYLDEKVKNIESDLRLASELLERSEKFKKQVQGISDEDDSRCGGSMVSVYIAAKTILIDAMGESVFICKKIIEDEELFIYALKMKPIMDKTLLLKEKIDLIMPQIPAMLRYSTECILSSNPEAAKLKDVVELLNRINK